MKVVLSTLEQASKKTLPEKIVNYYFERRTHAVHERTLWLLASWN